MSEIPGQMPLFDLPDSAETGAIAPDSQRITQLRALLEERRQANAGLVREMGVRYKRRPDPSSVILTRLNCLVDLVFGDEQEPRLSFELEFETEMGELLRDQLDKANQLSLLDIDRPLPTNGRPIISGSGFITP